MGASEIYWHFFFFGGGGGGGVRGVLIIRESYSFGDDIRGPPIFSDPHPTPYFVSPCFGAGRDLGIEGFQDLGIEGFRDLK